MLIRGTFVIEFYIRKVIYKINDLTVSLLLYFKIRFSCGGAIKIKGAPIIHVSKGALIKLGNNVTLNSRNYGYHANMYGPVKLMADRPGAIIKIGSNSRINGACVHACGRVEIGRNCLIAANVQIIDSNGHNTSFDHVENRINTNGKIYPVIIGDNVWIGLNAIILPGVNIGDGSIIGANTVVTTDVPSMVIFSGNPGSVIKRF
jgi:acetyltransferase-like isoleucine patch superfamily enzyme